MHNSSQSIPSESGSSTLIGSSTVSGSQFLESAPQPTSGSTLPATDVQQSLDVDVKSEASFDPLFDDEPDADGEPDNDSAAQHPSATGSSDPPKNEPPAASVGSDPVRPDGTHAAQPQAPQPPTRGTLGIVAPPKNAPPLLDPAAYATFSPDLLMTASIDGQVILWDKRVHVPGKGVGRLWMSEKTPPWCLSVSFFTDG